jgi:hypothetical protein
LTDEQIDNFKSACGNVSLLSYFFNGWVFCDVKAVSDKGKWTKLA